MSDPLAAAAAEDVSPDLPATLTAEQIKELVKAEAQRISDERVKGLQSSNAKVVQALRNELEAVKRRVPTDPDDDQRADLDAERRRLERERDLWKTAAANPQYAALLTSLNEAEDYEAQVAVLSAWSQASAPASPPASDEPVTEPEPTPAVDPNRPIRQPSGWGPGGPTGDQAQAFLNANFKSRDSWPEFG